VRRDLDLLGWRFFPAPFLFFHFNFMSFIRIFRGPHLRSIDLLNDCILIYLFMMWMRVLDLGGRWLLTLLLSLIETTL